MNVGDVTRQRKEIWASMGSKFGKGKYMWKTNGR